MLQGKHSAILSTFIKLPFITKIFVLSIFEWPLKTGFTVVLNVCSSLVIILLRKRELVHFLQQCFCCHVTVNVLFRYVIVAFPGPEVIKLFSCSTQLNTKFILLINVKMPTIVGILTFISMINTTSERDLKQETSSCGDILLFMSN